MGVEPILFTRLHPVAHLSTGRARGFRLVAKKAVLSTAFFNFTRSREVKSEQIPVIS